MRPVERAADTTGGGYLRQVDTPHKLYILLHSDAKQWIEMPYETQTLFCGRS
jgi:hypothetical protein